MKFQWTSGYSNVSGGGQLISYSLHHHLVPHCLGSRTFKLPAHKLRRLPSAMFPLYVAVPLPTCWAIPWRPLVGDTHLPVWACTKYPSPLTAIGDWLSGFAGVHHIVEGCSARTFLPTLWRWHTFPATSTTPRPLVMFVLFSGAR